MQKFKCQYIDNLGNTSHEKKNVFVWALPKLPLLPPSPQFGQVVQPVLDVKNNVLARITEPCNDDYDNDVSDNCDHHNAINCDGGDNWGYNFDTFGDFRVKNDQKVSHNMILMSRYIGTVTWWKKGQKFGQGPPLHPPIREIPERKVFYYMRCSLSWTLDN